MSKKLTSEAATGAAKFLACGVVIGVIAVCIACGDDLTPYKAFLYTVAGGVCVRLLWPTQDQGDALIEYSKK